MKIFCILVLCSIVLSASADEDDSRGMIQFCGKRLAQAYVRACAYEYKDFYNLEDLQNPKPEAGNDDMRGQRRNKRSLVEECCYNVCTIDEFLSYC
uniref:Insulin-like peptide 2 n=1 Tax=Spodoptera exigua TaxID=7107 RepID=A0A060A470_SPOEX|nr:insulin-like peptide 2 [Spodoptera exigua]